MPVPGSALGLMATLTLSTFGGCVPGVVIVGALGVIATAVVAFGGCETGTKNKSGNSSQNRKQSDTRTQESGNTPKNRSNSDRRTQKSGNTPKNQSNSGNRGTTSEPGDNGIRCRPPNSASYSWQFQEDGSPIHSWNDFGPSDNAALEELYCDVENLEVKVNLKDTASRYKKLFSEGVSVNFEQMTMISPSSKQFSIHRHSEPSYLQVPNKRFSTRWVWYWEDNDGWKKYSEAKESSVVNQEKIEAAFLDGATIYSFQLGSYDYTITFDDKPMCQINMENGTIRRVRRRPLFSDRIPKVQAMDFERTNLEKDCEEYQTVSQRFHTTMPERQASIVMVEKIKNDCLFKKYRRKLQEMKKKRKPRREKLLFHGTTSNVVDAICTHNFDPRMCGKNGTKYGQGSYFAVDASYSNCYSKTAKERTRYMFLAKVLTGEFKRGEQSLRRPPLKDPSNPAGDMYDSCVDDESQPKVFVIFSDEQCYPLYLIKYHLK